AGGHHDHARHLAPPAIRCRSRSGNADPGRHGQDLSLPRRRRSCSGRRPRKRALNPSRALLLLAVLALAACSPGKADLEAYVAEVKARPGPPLEPLPVMQQFETFEYKAQELRDPFSVPKQSEEIATQGPRPDPDRRKEYLESFPLDGLDMVGSLGTGEELVAL